jgi:hypothetical protein
VDHRREGVLGEKLLQQFLVPDVPDDQLHALVHDRLAVAVDQIIQNDDLVLPL